MVEFLVILAVSFASFMTGWILGHLSAAREPSDAQAVLGQLRADAAKKRNDLRDWGLPWSEISDREMNREHFHAKRYAEFAKLIRKEGEA